MPGAYLGPRPTNTRQGSFDAGKAASGAGSFIANNLLGIDDMKNAVQHAKEGDWAGVAKSGLAIGAELGGTLAAGASIALSGGAAAPGVAALYAGKVASKKAGKEAIEEVVGKTAKSKAEEATLKTLKAKDKQEQKAAIKNNKLDRLDVMNKSPDELANDTLESLNPFKTGKNNGTGKGSGSGTGSGKGSGSGSGTGSGSGGTGTFGSGGTGTGTGTSGGGSGGRSGTATLERTDTNVTTRGPGGQGGPEGEPISRPKIEKPKTPTDLTRPGGTSGEVGQEQVIKIGAETGIIKPAAAVPDAASSITSGHQLILNTGAVAGLGLNNMLQNELKQSTPNSTGTTTATSNPSSGGGGGNGKKPPLPGMDFGQQDVKLKRVY